MRLVTVFTLCAGMIVCAYADTIDSYVTRVCGGKNTCNSSLPRDSCCRPCECDDICLEKGTCCDDKIFNMTKNITMQKCLPSVKRTNTFRNRKISDNYYVRANCPARYGDRQTSRKCETGEPESLEDIPFVSSNDGKIVYKNRHCAACHGEKDVIPWKLIVDLYCIKETFLGRSGMSLSANASYITEKLLNVCSFSFAKPTVTEMRYTVCYKEDELISQCNSMRLSDKFTEPLKDMCLNDKSALPFFLELNPNRVFANVYCYLCNARSNVTCDVQNHMKTNMDFTFLLDLRPLKEAEKIGSHVCSQAEIYDNFFGVCRPIVCPMFAVPVRGRCRSLVASSQLNYVFNFQIIPTSHKTWQDGEFYNFLSTVSKSLPSAIGLEGCTPCSAESLCDPLSEITNSTECSILYFQFIITTSSHCKRGRVLSLAAELEEKNLTLVFNDVSLMVDYIWSNQEYKYLTKRAKTVLESNSGSCRYLTPSKIENCRKVKFTLTEYNKLAKRSNITNVQIIENEDTIEMCIDDYQRLIEPEASHGTEWKPLYISVVPSLVFLVLMTK